MSDQNFENNTNNQSNGYQQPNGYQPNNYQQPNGYQQPQGYQVPAQSNGKATASLVLGILAVICVFFGYGALLGVALGIVGLVLGIAAKKETQSGQATAGIVLSAIAIALCAVTFLACLACLGGLASMGFYM